MPRALLPLLLVLAAAGVLRLVALDAQLPQTRDADSLVVAEAGHIEEHLAGEGEDELELSPLYPHLLPWLIAALPGRLERSAPPDAPLAAHLAAARHPDLTARRLIALLSLLAVPGTYVLARRMLTPGWSLVAAAFVATSLLHLLYGRMARPHGPMTSFAVWTVAALPWALRTGSAWRVGACGVLAALTVGCLHSGLAVLPACALACVFLAVDRGPRALWLASVPTALLALGLFLFYPFARGLTLPLVCVAGLFLALARPRAGLALAALGAGLWLVLRFGYGFEGGKLFADRPFEEDALGGQGFRRILWAFKAHDPVLGVLALAGVVALAVRAARGGRFWQTERGRAALLAAAHAGPYAVAIGLYYQNWHRFSIVLVPYAAVLAALALAFVVRRMPARARPASAVVLTLAALALPSYAAGRFLWLQRQPDAYEHLAAWVEDNVERGELCVASNLLSLPVEQDLTTARLMPRWLASPWQQYIRRVQPAWPGGGYPIRTLYVRPEKSDDPRRVTVADVQRVMKRLEPAFAFVVTPSGPRAAFDETPQAIEAAGGVLIERIRLFESSELLGDRGGREHFGDEALRFVLGARGMGPSIDVFRLNAEQEGR